MTRRIRSVRGSLTPEQREHFRRVRDEVEAEKPQILEQAKRWFAEAERGRDALREIVRPLHEARERAGLSIEQLAERGRFEADDFRRLEDGDPKTDLATLFRYAEAVGLEVRIGFVEQPMSVDRAT